MAGPALRAELDNEQRSKDTDRQTCQIWHPGCNLPETAVLHRIREGRGPRDSVAKDILAVLRDKTSSTYNTESYSDMRKILLAWNRRINGGFDNDADARELLRLAVDRRAHLLKAPARGSDKSQFLKDSSAEMLQALTALRPEIADFKNQDFLDILLTMWANVLIATPGLDDDLKLLTMKALINELESKSHTSNAVKLSGIARSLSVARLQLDSAEVERLEKKMQAFESKLRETVVKRAIDKIKAGRRKLTAVKLGELQELTELQAAQKWATHAALRGDQQRRIQITACDQMDGRLQRVLQHRGPGLDAHIHAVQSNANALAGMSVSLLSRATEAGFSLENQSSSMSIELGNVDVKAYVTGGIADILNAREQAAKMLAQMDTVNSHLEVMLDAAKSKYRACDEVLRLVEQADNKYNEEVQRVEKLGFGLPRETILLMCRNAQRAK
ncbi:uncharacterized protein M421DRAFT_96768 [Didymella exigua CBS 183.55]|uniref:Uncharacterized protein n=1 Tax=Didymella exigua CBS 183.55 TaxID=1150837 RepID=A0A6A5R5L9_9PLEO|nr:uncharacterized protein M421DRAFT_96768 [Didymella exigua CBS 183.55]KAF1922480.1 hypothetical protein M421DRAFT_96768 [Didymella exigua CBS 183.55]